MKIALAFLAAALGALPVRAQAPTPPAQDALLDRLAGRWVLEGQVLGKPTTHDMDAEWVLGHQYMRLHEVAREKKPDGSPRYEALAFVAIDRTSGGYTILWLDATSGDGLSLDALGRATRSGETISFVFRDKDGTTNFLNAFAHDAKADAWTWTLDNVKDGKPVPFATFRLARNGPAPK